MRTEEVPTVYALCASAMSLSGEHNEEAVCSPPSRSFKPCPALQDMKGVLWPAAVSGRSQSSRVLSSGCMSANGQAAESRGCQNAQTCAQRSTTDAADVAEHVAVYGTQKRYQHTGHMTGPATWKTSQ